jgi:predicted secreted Zn-dependent protease
MRFLAAAFCIAALAAGAQVFRWKDADGKVHYGDRPPADVKAEETKIYNIPREDPARDVEVAPVEMEYFTVQGMTLAHLRETMRETAPKDVEGVPRWGMARWRLQWKFEHARAADCRIGTFRIAVTSRITMPRWPDRERAPQALQEMWERFYRALLAHENGHRDNGIRAANDLARRLRGMPAHRDCPSLNAAIENIGQRIVGEYQLVDKAYDRSTDHGVSQGAVFR